jgi:ribosome maturation factor RimP
MFEMLTEKQVASFLEEKFSEEGFRDCFLVDVEIKGGSRASVYIDSETGVGFAECRSVSRFLEGKIEEKGLMNPDYKLEVSSPGVDRPLRYRKQYPKHKGRELKVELADEVKKGRLVEIGGESIVLEITVGSKKKAEKIREEINFDSIKSAKVLISFK